MFFYWRTFPSILIPEKFVAVENVVHVVVNVVW